MGNSMHGSLVSFSSYASSILVLNSLPCSHLVMKHPALSYTRLVAESVSTQELGTSKNYGSGLIFRSAKGLQ